MIENIHLVVPLLLGFVLDALIGDPYYLPHPIRLFGKAIAFGEKLLNKGKRLRLKGMFLTITLVGITFSIFYIGFSLLLDFDYVFLVLATIFVFYGLANRSLIYESLKVINTLDKKGLKAGRQQLSMIVGRDTTQLDENQIRTAVLETLAENLSDGVIAPLFFYALGGVPAMLAYKMVNTLDSMTGYKSERYLHFGWFAAKFDDVLNFVPARITALLMAFLTLNSRGLRFLFRYGKKHNSPNAGYPEAALAGILNCRFGGPNIYHGKLVQKPFIGENDRAIITKDVRKACYLNFSVALVSVLLILLWYI